ncbi:unnamed protein product [Meganyctiphanes norvegica]|uniref:Uncharacterized protein n=1 Tax=Meganyctiphanes norvegica TaxID=48144 RepID=A0AAV2RSX8_MEGNR
MLGLTSRETADLAKKSHDVSRKNNNSPSKIDKVTYCVKPSKNTTITKKLSVPPHTSFFDIMKKAQKGDNAFKFNYTMYNFTGVDEAYITSIGGVAEEISNGSGLVWMLYNCTQAAQCVDPTECSLSDTGVSITHPKDGGIWLFNYEHQNWNETHH